MSGVAIIDSGGANIASLLFAFNRLGVAADLTDDAEIIRDADRVLLPGVGAARDAMNRLRDKELAGIIPALEQPVLGICLGMQLLCKSFQRKTIRNVLASFPEPCKDFWPVQSIRSRTWAGVKRRSVRITGC